MNGLHKKVAARGQWIWHDNNSIPNDYAVFRRQFTFKAPPASAVAYIAAETKYWLYVNGQPVVFEGGLFRESLPGAGYADPVELAPFVREGVNTIAILCRFYGNGGRNNIRLPHAGLLFSCDALGLYSSQEFLCMRHPAYYTPGKPEPSYLFGGHNVGFDANKDIGDFTAHDFDDSRLRPAAVYPADLYGDVYERPIPLHRRGEYVKIDDVGSACYSFRARLPYAEQFTPAFEIMASGGEIIDIRTDRCTVNGGPGDEHNRYNSHRLEYICKPGRNIFESANYLYGEEIILSCSKPVDILEAGYYPCGYDCDIVGFFKCDDSSLNKLVEKAARTLYVCMRDNFMDCPDRERGQWIGDISVQVPQVMAVLCEKSRLLVKKSIMDFINLRQGDILLGLVPGENALEVPAQNLNAISEWGLIAQYHKYTGDTSVLELMLEPAVRYLMRWGMGSDGLLKPGESGWRWFDHLYNIDEPVLENAWYYSALKFLRRTADILHNPQFNRFLDGRIASIQESFDKRFFSGEYYASSAVVDDRANAMAVLSGLASKERYPHVRKVLLTVFNSSVYMENYVLLALCEMGFIKDAYRRMMSRYHNLAENDSSTLWEDFFILGTKNHAWSGAPLTVAFRYFLGMDTLDGGKSYTFSPCKDLFEKMHGRVAVAGGYIDVSYDKQRDTLSKSTSGSMPIA